MSALRDALQDHVDRQWATIRAAIEQLGDDGLKTGDGYMLPVRHLVHVVNCCAFYFRDQKGGFDWGARFGGDEEELPVSKLPSGAELLAYLDEIEAQTKSWLDGKDDEALLAPDSEFPWTGPNAAARLIYTIRHSQDHFGQINAMLRSMDQPRIAWR